MAWLVKFAVAAMMPGSATLPSAADLGLAEFIPRFLKETSWIVWAGAVGASLAFMLTPLLTVYRPVPAVMLSDDLLDQHADSMATHRFYLLRQAALMIKMVAGLQWGARPEIRAQFGLPAYPSDPGTWRTG